MKIDYKKALLNSALGKNVKGALEALKNDDITRADVKIGGDPLPGAVGSIKTDLDLEVDIHGISCHIELDNVVISLLEGQK